MDNLSELDQAVIEAAEAFEGTFQGVFRSRDDGGSPAGLIAAVRYRREAMKPKPKPRYEIAPQSNEHDWGRVYDRKAGRDLTVGKIVALLNRQEEK